MKIFGKIFRVAHCRSQEKELFRDDKILTPLFRSKIFYILDDVADGANATICLSVIKSFNILLHLEFYCFVELLDFL